ncbi:uncharacterized protein LOC6054712 [Culex quinquefasciatus]|uniref:uncharacterized protein LOC6054712 n=1 Tax=Culex quinquefasciatus TaxID=7176 RepID=UPI0018E2F895|nr:uncharacterized protein LOC6054712 [Culex quinquefasciatus]
MSKQPLGCRWRFAVAVQWVETLDGSCISSKKDKHRSNGEWYENKGRNRDPRSREKDRHRYKHRSSSGKSSSSLSSKHHRKERHRKLSHSSSSSDRYPHSGAVSRRESIASVTEDCLRHRHTLSCRYLINPSTSSEFMYKVQRQRKIWWMRYVCDPGRFFISDLEEDLGDFRIKVGRTSSKRIRPSMLRLRQCVEVATLQIVLDAFESGGDASVRVHRKLTPFKCGIVCLSDSKYCVLVSDLSCNCLSRPALLPELRDQAKHLCNVLRKANLPVLDCSERNGGRSLAKQLHHLDSIAVPY